MPKLWSATIETHRREVREAILDTTARLAAELGIRSVTMSQIAGETGIGRATLYKYFPDVESILIAWHDRQVSSHLEQLTALSDRAGDARAGLEAVLDAYAVMTFHRPIGTELAALVHRDDHLAQAEQHLNDLVRRLLIDGVERGDVRDDVAPDELASYCLRAATAAHGVSSEAAVHRLVTVIMAGLRPPT